jgi:FlaA1/EpsC-like NDP-sugar epimerase
MERLEQPAKTVVFVIFDAFMINIAYLGALALRFDLAVPGEYLQSYFALAPLITVLTLAVFYLAGFYRKMWQYASVKELYDVLNGVSVATLVVIAAVYIFVFPTGVVKPLPRSIYPIAWLISLIFTGGSRFWLRSQREFRNGSAVIESWNKAVPVKKKNVLIIGAGEAGAMVVRELRNHPALGLEPVGFVDDAGKQGLYLLDLPVLGRRDDIPDLVAEWGIDEIIIAMPSASGKVIREIEDICKKTGAGLKTIPGVYDLIDGKISVSQIREVQLEDLLGREPVQLDMDGIAAYLQGKVIMVTGAGGSIGSELCRQIIRFYPKALILVDNTENNLFEIEMELCDRCPKMTLQGELADVRNQRRIRDIFKKYRPQVIFHAAAYKHVPMMERFPELAVSNNIFGTYVVAQAACDYEAETFILVSTDKAVNPANVMGASKRAAEMVVQYLNQECERENRKTRFAAVRFGNVLGSRGSVVPIFKRQIAQGGPVTVTHPEMVRYFMTIPEAVQLIIQAGALAEGGEIFILDMGEPVRIVDLARDLISLSGFEPDEEIEIKFTGIRPGEKLREELLTDREKMSATRNRRIFVAHNGDGEYEVGAVLVERMQHGCGMNSSDEALELLRLLPEAFNKSTGG